MGGLGPDVGGLRKIPARRLATGLRLLARARRGAAVESHRLRGGPATAGGAGSPHEPRASRGSSHHQGGRCRVPHPPPPVARGRRTRAAHGQQRSVGARKRVADRVGRDPLLLGTPRRGAAGRGSDASGVGRPGCVVEGQVRCRSVRQAYEAAQAGGAVGGGGAGSDRDACCRDQQVRRRCSSHSCRGRRCSCRCFCSCSCRCSCRCRIVELRVTLFSRRGRAVGGGSVRGEGGRREG